MPEVILPGTYITVRDEGLITAGRIATGYVGVVGTAERGPVDQVVILGSFAEARAAFGEADPWQDGTKGELTLIRSLELAFNNGASTVYAVRVAAGGAGGAAPAALALKTATTTVMRILAKTPGTWGNALKARVSTSSADATVKVLEISLGTQRESFAGKNAGELAAAVARDSRLATATVEGARNSSVPDDVLEAAALKDGANGQGAASDDYGRGLEALENEIVNIVVLAGQDAGKMGALLQGHLNRTAGIRRERIGVIGSNGTDDADRIAQHTLASDRLVFVAPGIRARVTDPETRRETEVSLPGAYTAAAVAGLISSLPVQTSPTNKPLTIGGLAATFNQPRLEKLVQNRVLAVEKREGYRIVKGITTATNPAWHQITTRRIVDYAMYGVRSACNPYIGKLNNERVRGAMKATIDGFLTRMVQDEALTGYQLEVSATRAQEIAGECMVTMTLQPTFSIDFIMVTMYLS
ncbi:MAG TPA: phage tail sheath C-terminal domain-containing protein [Longimicrobium sp.]|nr:phage tail sheath C-terminal domain-containing protein [Longimicrobium sp.]